MKPIMKTIINIWLTLIGPVAFALATVTLLFEMKGAADLNAFSFALGGAISTSLSAWGLFNRIWEIGK